LKTTVRVFVSYSSVDKKQVKRLVKDLRAAGVDTWFDEREIRTGEPVTAKVQAGLTQSDYLAVWLTKNAVASGWVEREWQSRYSDEIKQGRTIILPLLAETCEMPALLKDKRYADFRKDYSAGLKDLLRTLRVKQTSVASDRIRVVVLAGGLAKRLWPLTNDLPKAMLRLAGGTALQHLIATLNEVDNVDEILVSIDENKARHFSQAIEMYKASKVPVSIIQHSLEGGAIKGPVAKLQELAASGRLAHGTKGWNLVVAVDNVFTFSLNDFISFALERGASCNAVIEKQISPREYGVARTTGDVLDSVIEKPDKTEDVVTKISTACYVYRGADLGKTAEYLERHRGDDNLGAFIAWLCQKSTVLACSFNSEWFDIGTREGLLNGNRLLISRKGITQPGLIPGDYKIKSPVYIEDGVTIFGSVVGPNVYLGKNCVVRDSVISDAIVYEDCQILSCRPFQHIVAGPHSTFEGKIGEAVYGPHTKISTGAD
jgi:NDP-sugar pyrophosphorylase family protein